MSEPMTFRNSIAAFLEKGWEKRRKAQHSHSNRSSVCCGSLGGRVTRRVCLLRFQCICHVIKSLAWELKGEFCLVFSATCGSEAHTDPCVKVHAACTLMSALMHLSQTNLVFFHRLVGNGKMQYVGRWGNSQEFLAKQWSVCCKSTRLLGKLNMLLF